MADEGERMPEKISMTTFSLPKGAKVKILGTTSLLKWKKTDTGFIINIPEKIRKSPPSKYVWVMEVFF